jgi:hypothetical protein
MTPALEQIKALPAKWRQRADAKYPRGSKARNMSPDVRYEIEGRCEQLDACADELDTALQALRDEAGEADLRQRLGEALTAVLTDPAAAPEPDWNDAREVDRIIDAILPAIAARPAPAAEAAQHPDDAAVDRFAAALKAKLAEARAKGRGGWDTDECNAQMLSDMLRDHVAKGDPRDVGNFAMFLHQRGESIVPPAAEAAPQGGDVCFCDAKGLGVPGVSCGDCPRDYAATPPSAPVTDMTPALEQSNMADISNLTLAQVEAVLARFGCQSAAAPQPASLEWSPTLCDGKHVSHADAEKACVALGEGWRLPTRMELESILDLTRHEPAIDTARFPDTKSGWYWTSTPCAWSSDCAWFVSFGLGDADGVHRDGRYASVRAVRSVPAGQ